MGEPAEKKSPPMVELPADRFDRLLLLLERLAQAQERLLAQDQDNARRAAKKAGPTTALAQARVAARLARLRGR
jgi:chemotaxis protein histidine kinase CheA